MNKTDILDAWIMVEHLSEGDINPHHANLVKFDNIDDRDFFRLFRTAIEKKKLANNPHAGLVFYADIFDFGDVVDFLRHEFRLPKLEEDLKYGNKFSFVLCFGSNLTYDGSKFFFTESGYIKKRSKLPSQSEFKRFEVDFGNRIAQAFQDLEGDADLFNKTLENILDQAGISLKNCAFEVVKNLDSDIANLHSFFIADLESAKDISAKNLDAYLYGGNPVKRINLDSNKDSSKFNGAALEAILDPENYPLGRFPSNTDYGLSLMQQVAVNLCIGFDYQDIRSVNGPPGTGKTTLLKDIFAELVVKQAHNICRLDNRMIKGTAATVYWDKASIGEVPDSIAKDSIVVLSSNNGAVQNIVKELPLSKGLDARLLDDLLYVDYFTDIANADVQSMWKKAENGKMKHVVVSKPQQQKNWGMFSLEGGKTANINNMLDRIELMRDYLTQTYQPNPAIYEIFEGQYRRVKDMRARASDIKRAIEERMEVEKQLKHLQSEYPKQKVVKTQEVETVVQKVKGLIAQSAQQVADWEESGARIRVARLELSDRIIDHEAKLYHKEKEKPGFFAGRKARKKHREDMGEMRRDYRVLLHKDKKLAEEESTIERRVLQVHTVCAQAELERVDIQEKFEKWDRNIQSQMAELGKRINSLRARESELSGKPLDLSLSYDELQRSSPWFDSKYRNAQSQLFALALAVRKEFLYENVKNLQAAINIWSRQDAYADNKRAIKAAWNWISMAIPVISSTFASVSRMLRNIGPRELGHVFIDEAGQALPQAAVGAIYRARDVTAVGDPSQIKPVLTLQSNVLTMLGNYYQTSERYLSEAASVQTLVDMASQYGCYPKVNDPESWIGIPLWVHRRCQCPMFTISNELSYHGQMVQSDDCAGEAQWIDIGGRANNKYVKEQGEFLRQQLQAMILQDPSINDARAKDVVYVISPFKNVADCLAKELDKIGFTRRVAGKPTNIGTIHTFQGKEAPIVFLVLGADENSKGAAAWAVREPNMMNVAATRAKQNFYIIGNKSLYESLGSETVRKTIRIIDGHNAA
ncbi:adenylate kinase family enzyme [Arcanobacterium pluranimalium]|uniref:DEAD/DEAH box helicase n=1 Tax=Arcanobacterium pluranimalium TaxID=108028 RepID=UPI001959E397|nr:AAA domain-containing protein [Arcanobacterium pluranimalium]MBM7824299.1 adenylate kinase family enzyme [Arcanobacterium pluranimalium]